MGNIKRVHTLSFFLVFPKNNMIADVLMSLKYNKGPEENLKKRPFLLNEYYSKTAFNITC